MYKKYLKRAIDFVISSLAIILLFPLLLIITILVKLDSRGPVLFKQKRIGKNQTIFYMYKFRSMKIDTPKEMPTHLLENPEKWITRFGSFLRKSSLDELPQLFNILIGHMSIIGPRPALWNQLDLIQARESSDINSIRPGLTGWAQINGRDELSIDDKVKFDQVYVENLSFLFDLKCFFLTILKVLKSDGIVEGKNIKIKKKIIVISAHTKSLFWFRLDMMKSFISNDFDVVAIGNESEEIWLSKFKQESIKYNQIEVNRNGLSVLGDVQYCYKLYKIIKDEAPDKLFIYQAKPMIYGSIAAKLNHISDVYLLVAGLGSIFRSNDFKSIVIKEILKFEYKLAFKLSKKVIFQNNDDKSFCLDHKILNNKKAEMINGSGVNIEIFKPKILPNKPVFLFIGRLLKDKGITEYLEACRIIQKKYKDVRCLLVGPFDSNPSSITKEELNSYIDDGSIEYFGEAEDVIPYLEMCSTFVLPSYHEGTPKSVLEAMACGRSIITTNAPGCKETVINGENGYLVPIKNIDAIVEKMEFLINNPKLTKQMGLRSIEIVKEKYDVIKVNQKISSIMGIN